MAPYPMTDVIAQREFLFEGTNGSRKVTASIGKPAPMPNGIPRDWYCPYVIEGVGNRIEHYAAGVDSLQALLMGISGLRAHMQHIASKGKMTFLEHEDLRIELVGGAA